MTIDHRGRHARDVKIETEHKIIEELPAWCGGAMYHADTDTIVLVVKVPASEHANPHVLMLESTPDEARAVIEALQLCATRSQQASRILDVPASSSR